MRLVLILGPLIFSTLAFRIDAEEATEADDGVPVHFHLNDEEAKEPAADYAEDADIDSDENPSPKRLAELKQQEQQEQQRQQNSFVPPKHLFVPYTGPDSDEHDEPAEPAEPVEPAEVTPKGEGLVGRLKKLLDLLNQG